MIDAADTIVAIASPTAPAPRGIVRVSGDEVLSLLERLGIEIRNRVAASRFDAEVDLGMPLGVIPIGVMLWPTSRSYTGQPSAELHTYGSLPILRAIVDVLIAVGGRAARPGEFTMRAFLAGRLDLTQAEAVLGVIDAHGRGSLDHALRQLAGNLSRPLEEMRSTMLDLLADVEAGLDFVDEDIEFVSDEALIDRLTRIKEQLSDTQRNMTTRGGGDARVVITLRGEPNAGKSRLINCLVNREVAIVADVAGTTRDVVTIDTDLEGRLVRLVDTAGMEETDQQHPEAEIANRSQQQADRAGDEANIRLWCVDSGRDDFAAACGRVTQQAGQHQRNAIDIWVATKTDLPSATLTHPDWIATSCVTSRGIDDLNRAIIAAIDGRDSEEVGSVLGTAARCSQTLQRASESVTAAIELTQNVRGHEFVAAELRTAVECLGEVTGAVYTDDILDRVFGRFCIGK